MKLFLRTSGMHDADLANPAKAEFWRFRFPDGIVSYFPHPGPELIKTLSIPIYCYISPPSIYNSTLAPAQDPTLPIQLAMSADHPDWILKDDAGNLLWIPFNCRNGQCDAYAADFTNPAVIDFQCKQVKAIKAAGFAGLWLDNANMDIRCSDGAGNIVTPAGIDGETWARAMAHFLEAIRAAAPPPFKIIHNPLRNSTAPAEYIARQITACDRVNLEYGFSWGGPTLKAIAQTKAFIDLCHNLGRPVIIEETGTPVNLADTCAAFDAFCARDDWFALDTLTAENIPAVMA